MGMLRQTTRSVMDMFKRCGIAMGQSPDRHLCGGHELPCEELESAPEYVDGFITRMIQLSQMPRTRSPREKTAFSMRAVAARPA